jgi:hypothetical protein
MIYAPSQIALAAVIHAASRQKKNLVSYFTESLFGEQGEEAILHIITCVRNIRVMVKNIPDPTPNIKTQTAWPTKGSWRSWWTRMTCCWRTTSPASRPGWTGTVGTAVGSEH